MYNYPVIIFEGIETSGKTVQIKNLTNYLKKIKKKFIKIREPGGSNNSETLRKLILKKKSNLNYKTDLLLILASRSENYEKIIKKYYRRKIIIIDRFIDSTIAYQHFGMNISLNLIKNLNNLVTNNFKPDFTFLNIVNKKNMKKRLKKRNNNNKYDFFNYNFYNKVQKGFLEISKNKKQYMIIDSNKDIEINKKIIINKINEILKIK